MRDDTRLAPIGADIWDELLQRDAELGGPRGLDAKPVGRARSSPLDEREVIGAALEDPALLPALVSLVSPGDYADPVHGLVWQAIQTAASRGALTDTAVSAVLRSEGHTLGVLALGDLREYAPGYLAGSPSHTSAALAAAERVAGYAVTRRVAEAARTLHADALDWRVPVHDVLARLAGVQAEGARGQAAVVPIGHDVDAWLAELSEACETGTLPGVQTGLGSLDRATNGLRPAQLLVLAARPGVGKTSLAAHLGAAVASTRGPVLFFSQEMARRELLERLMSSVTGVPLASIIGRVLTSQHLADLASALPSLAALPLLVRDAEGITIGQLRAVARAQHARHPLALVVVDYLQIVRPDERSESREREVREIADGLKGLAKELDIPVLALAQMNREVEKSERAPRMSDLRESGAIEANADVVAFLHRTGCAPGEVKVSLVKQRSAKSGAEVVLCFEGETQRWRDPAEDLPAEVWEVSDDD